jgi:hypothetical protein
VRRTRKSSRARVLIDAPVEKVDPLASWKRLGGADLAIEPEGPAAQQIREGNKILAGFAFHNPLARRW